MKDIKSEVKKLVVHAKCQELASMRGDGDAEEYHHNRSQQSLDAINRWADMANAAIAVAEYQATSGYDPEADIRDYTVERGRLWHAFIMARAKVKGVGNGST